MKLKSTRTIQAPIQRVFDMVRDVDVHAAAVPEIEAKAIEGRLHGLLEPHEQTRWSATYFGRRFQTTMEVAEMDWPLRYVETNTTGPFRTFQHEYTFEHDGKGITTLHDELTLVAGYGVFGRLLDRWILGPRLQKALEERMDHLKQWSEDGTWKTWLLEDPPEVIDEAA